MNLTTLRTQYRDEIIALVGQYNADNVRVFGSVARGKEKSHSNIDLLVHFNTKASLLDESALGLALGDLTGKKVD